MKGGEDCQERPSLLLVAAGERDTALVSENIRRTSLLADGALWLPFHDEYRLKDRLTEDPSSLVIVQGGPSTSARLDELGMTQDGVRTLKGGLVLGGDIAREWIGPRGYWAENIIAGKNEVRILADERETPHGQTLLGWARNGHLIIAMREENSLISYGGVDRAHNIDDAHVNLQDMWDRFIDDPRDADPELFSQGTPPGYLYQPFERLSRRPTAFTQIVTGNRTQRPMGAATVQDHDNTAPSQSVAISGTALLTPQGWMFGARRS